MSVVCIVLKFNIIIFLITYRFIIFDVLKKILINLNTTKMSTLKQMKSVIFLFFSLLLFSCANTEEIDTTKDPAMESLDDELMSKVKQFKFKALPHTGKDFIEPDFKVMDTESLLEIDPGFADVDLNPSDQAKSEMVECIETFRFLNFYPEFQFDTYSKDVVIEYNGNDDYFMDQLKEKVIHSIVSPYTLQGLGVVIIPYYYWPHTKKWVRGIGSVIPGYSIWPDRWWKMGLKDMSKLPPVQNEEDYSYVMSHILNHMALYQDHEGNLSKKPIETYSKVALSFEYYNYKGGKFKGMEKAQVDPAECPGSHNDYYSYVIGRSVRFFHIVKQETSNFN